MRRCLALVLAVATLVAGTARPALAGSVADEAAPSRSPFIVPVEGPVVDPWRPPVARFGAGNRGQDHATVAGSPVRASAAGEVVFAGQVGGALHVVVLHDAGIRSSYSYLASLGVRRGEVVAQGQQVGTSGSSVHIGFRVGADYVDPASLLEGRARFRLVPLRHRRPLPLAEEVRSLIRGLGRIGSAGFEWARAVPGEVVGDAVAAVEAVRAEVEATWRATQLAGHYLALTPRWDRYLEGMNAFQAAQVSCTPGDVALPRPPPGRRIAVLVAGLGSSSDEAAVLDVPTRRLGYADRDVAMFSYAGGQSPGRRRLDDVPVNRYGSDESFADVDVAAERLRALLESIRFHHPGVPVDVIAHSQGGLVVRAALGAPGEGRDPRLSALGEVITLGTPHRGAPLATAAAAVGTTTVGTVALAAVGAVSRGTVPVGAEAVADLDETSGFIGALADRPLPAGAEVTAIAASGDLIVPALGNALPGATNVLVPLSGASAHDELPGSSLAVREMALALSGRAPRCRSLWAAAAESVMIDLTEHLAGGAITFGAHAADRAAGAAVRRLGASTGRRRGR